MILAIVFAVTVTQGGDAKAVRDLEAIEQRLAVTWQSGDCSVWGAMLAPEWSVIHVTGQVITRAEALEMCKAPRPPAFSVKIDAVSVRVFASAAVVTGVTTATTGDATVRLRFTDVFIRRAGAWQAVASQATQLAARGTR